MPKPQQIKQAIIEYASNNLTEYGVAITGKWGCGKTYCWREEIAPALTQTGKKCVLISLFGIKSTKEIEQKILYELISISEILKGNKDNLTSLFAELAMLADANSEKTNLGRSNLKTMFDAVTGLGSYYLLKKLLFDVKETVVLCFDDLERASLNISMAQLLGEINKYIEQHNIKTVVIANETEIDEENKKKYSAWKEKLIWQTYFLDPSIEETLDHFIKPYGNDFKQKIEQNKVIILKIVERADLSNYRTLQVCLQICCKFFNEVGEQTDLFPDIILIVFSLVIEIKIEKITDEQVELLRKWSEVGYDFTRKFGIPKSNAEESPKSYLTSFIEKYYYPRQYYFSRYSTSLAIFQYVTAGYFSPGEFKNDLDKISDSQMTPKKLFLTDFWQLEQNYFDQIKQEYLDDLSNCKIADVAEILKLCQFFFYLSREKIISESDANLAHIFKQANAKIFNQNLLQAVNFSDFRISHIIDDSDSLKDNLLYQQVKKQIINLNNAQYNRVIKQEAIELINHLDTEPKKFFKIIREKYEYSAESIFAYMNIFQLEKAIWSLDNSNLRSFNYLFTKISRSNRIIGSNQNDLSNLKKLKRLLERRVQPENESSVLLIKLRMIKDLITNISVAIEELENA
ncbi:MAG: P-loop NTPase fold protein [Cyanobacteria bacterium P01_G01_bin.39]